MSELRVVTYEEARKEFFEEKYKESIRKMEYWQKRAKNKSILSKENRLAGECGTQACYYEDALNALKGEIIYD